MAANEQLFRSFILGLRSNVVASYRSPLIIDWALSPDLHLDDCVKRGCIEEPRAKYLDSWASTFWDALRVNPARKVFRKSLHRGASGKAFGFLGVNLLGRFAREPSPDSVSEKLQAELHSHQDHRDFLWSDVHPQPNVDYIRRRIAKAVQVKPWDFRFVHRLLDGTAFSPTAFVCPPPTDGAAFSTSGQAGPGGGRRPRPGLRTS